MAAYMPASWAPCHGCLALLLSQTLPCSVSSCRDGTAKLGDVGLSKIMAGDYVSGVVGTLAWRVQRSAACSSPCELHAAASPTPAVQTACELDAWQTATDVVVPCEADCAPVSPGCWCARALTCNLRPPPTHPLCRSAPELLLGEHCTTKADIFSFGVVLTEICCNEVPVRGQLREPL